MKKHLLTSLAAILLVSFFLSNVTAGEKEGPKLSFTKAFEDLGKIQLSNLERMAQPITEMKIEFTNSGDEPLIISEVLGPDGTVIIEYPDQPILPGEKGIIKVEYRVDIRPYLINSTVSVMSNDPSEIKMFNIRGEVIDNTKPAPRKQLPPEWP